MNLDHVVDRRQRTRLAATAVLLCSTLAVAATAANAQEKFPLSYRATAAETRYVQQHAVEVGDVPGHQVRIYEIARTFKGSPPTFRGIAAPSDFTRGFSDYTDVNGRAWGYGGFLLENGDRVFTRYEGVSSSTVKPDGSRQSTNQTVIVITGGTGAFGGIRGILKSGSVFDPATGMNATEAKGEYWFEQ
jgi:hypothetical protein